MVAWTLLACGPGTPGDVATTEPAADAYALALGDCRATVEGTSGGDPYTTGALEYDERGDIVRAEWTYYESGNFYVTTFTFDDTHHLRSEVDDPPGRDDDVTTTQTWNGDNLVEIDLDYGSDGTVDEIELRTYDDDDLWISSHWDYDADGTPEDRVTLDWEADGDGWHGGGDGLDPYGSYTVEAWADPIGWIYRYAYADDRGLASDWYVSPRNELGNSTHVTVDESEGDLWESHLVRDYVLDGAGREQSEAYAYDLLQATDPVHLALDYQWSWDCP